MHRWPWSALLILVLGCTGGGATPTPGGTGGASGGTGGVSGGTGGAPSTGGVSGGTGGTPSTGGVSGSGGVVGGTGGSPDASADTAPTDSGPSKAQCPVGALVCEDFEGYADGPSLAPNWMTDNMGGTVMVDGTKPFTGAKAVHFSAPASTNSMLQIWKQGAPLFPLKNNTMYGRVMLWLSKQPTGGVHFNTVQANGLLPGTTQVAKYAYGAMFEKLMAGYTVRPTETALPTVDCGKSPGTTGYPAARWVCAEWKFDGANDEMHYWFDGVAQTAVDVIKTDPTCGAPGNRYQAPVFNKVMLGWYSQVYPMPIELWMDDVVISGERVGCPKMQ